VAPCMSPWRSRHPGYWRKGEVSILHYKMSRRRNSPVLLAKQTILWACRHCNGFQAAELRHRPGQSHSVVFAYDVAPTLQRLKIGTTHRSEGASIDRTILVTRAGQYLEGGQSADKLSTYRPVMTLLHGHWRPSGFQFVRAETD
jgi:hypothetical protein